MSCLIFPPRNENEIFRICSKSCGFISASEDQQHFALSCTFCTEKFLYFDEFISHIQTEHPKFNERVNGEVDAAVIIKLEPSDNEDISPAAEHNLLEPQLVIKGEIIERGDQDESNFINSLQNPEITHNLNCLKSEPINENFLVNNSERHNDIMSNENQDVVFCNYDDMVEESLLEDSTHTGYIKDRKMIKFLIHSYRRNPFLWNHLHPQFRDRFKRQKFLSWIVKEFERRFKVKIIKEAVTRKWDNLRTVYKRECNRMVQENTNISTLWYFKELYFLNHYYGGSQKMSDAVVKETVYRRRYSALWNDVSTHRLLELVRQYPCFYVKTHPDYRMKEKRGEALQRIAHNLQKIIAVSSIQISKRISQLRFDYSKQKMERLQCEQRNRVFVPSYTYYHQMLFMDGDIAPYKCKFCAEILQTTSEFDMHMMSHENPSSLKCVICNLVFGDAWHYEQHRQTHESRENQFNCDLCTATFYDEVAYEEHIQHHNDELLLPSLANKYGKKPHQVSADIEVHKCEICGQSFAQKTNLIIHRQTHSTLKCDFKRCGQLFQSRDELTGHLKMVHNEEYKCNVCGKIFKSSKNLVNHKQIHDAIKKYVCKICGSAFAQAAGLYLHKRRHNRANSLLQTSNLSSLNPIDGQNNLVGPQQG